MLRTLLNLAATLALLLTIAICVVWQRSYAASDRLMWVRDDGWRSVRSAQGRLVLSITLADMSGRLLDRRGVRYERDPAMPATVELLTIYLLCADASAKVVHWERADFAWQQRRSSRDLIVTAVAPFWSLAAATGTLPLAWAARRLRARRRRQRRARHGLCPACGYDCRATPAQCPECGATPSPKAHSPKKV
jgi:hypothetical protein